MSQIPPAIILAAKAQNLIAYKIKGSDKIYFRRKGKIPKDRYKTSPEFANARRVNAEFGGRSTATKWLMKALVPVKHIADYSVSAALNANLRAIQNLDTWSEWGSRDVALSLNPQLLQGFNLNNKNLMESVIQPDISFTLSRDTKSAKVVIPDLLAGTNFFNPGDFPFFKITCLLGVVPDLVNKPWGYAPPNGLRKLPLAINESSWMAYHAGSTAIEMDLVLPPVDIYLHTLMLSVGVSFGTNGHSNYILPVKYTGAAKILGLV